MKLFNLKMLEFNSEEITSWQEAVNLASQPLIDNGFVKPDYISKVIELTEKTGPYYIIAPELALLHISPCDTILKTGIGFTFFKKPVTFKPGGKHDVRFCFALASVNGTDHLSILQQLATLFTNKNFMEELKQCQNKEDLLAVVEKYDA